MEIEKLILKALTSNDEYIRNVSPFLKKEYFSNKSDQALYLIAQSYFKKYNSVTPFEVLHIELEKLKGINETIASDAINTIDILQKETLNSTTEWLIDTTEEFVQDRALHLALEKAIEIYKGDSKNLSKSAIPNIMNEALAVSFDHRLGHDYIDNAEDQFEYYHSDVIRVPTDVQILNDITNGGFPKKTLNSIILKTHGGKTAIMCSLACGTYTMGKNVLYITLEESEEEIRKRFDANLLNVSMDDLEGIEREFYLRKINSIKSKISSKFKVKHFNTKTASASSFRYLLEDYKQKHNFVPDIIFIDYLNLCLSDNSRSENKAYYIQSIAEELRGLASEANVCIFSAFQFNRSGGTKSDSQEAEMEDVSESYAALFTCDWLALCSRPEEMQSKNLIVWKQAKNRFKNLNFKKKFITGFDPYKMRIYDVEDTVQPYDGIDVVKSKQENKSYALIDNDGVILEENVNIKASKFKDFIFEED